jgi:hypothetical protein
MELYGSTDRLDCAQLQGVFPQFTCCTPEETLRPVHTVFNKSQWAGNMVVPAWADMRCSGRTGRT